MSLWYPPEGWQDLPSPFEDIDLEELKRVLAEYEEKEPTPGSSEFETPVTWKTLWAMSD
jgi:hypothetical protein